MRLAIGAVQVQKGAGQRRGVRSCQPQVRQRRGLWPEHRVRQRLAHVADQAFAVAGAQPGHVKAELLRQRQHHAGRNRAMVVFHLVQIGQRHAKLFCKGLLRQSETTPHFAKGRARIEFLHLHRLPPPICETSHYALQILEGKAFAGRFQAIWRARCMTQRIDTIDRAELASISRIKGIGPVP